MEVISWEVLLFSLSQSLCLFLTHWTTIHYKPADPVDGIFPLQSILMYWIQQYLSTPGWNWVFQNIQTPISSYTQLMQSVSKYSNNNIFYIQLMQSVSKASLPEVLQRHSPTTPPNNNSSNRYHYDNNVLVKNSKMLNIWKMKIGNKDILVLVEFNIF